MTTVTKHNIKKKSKKKTNHNNTTQEKRHETRGTTRDEWNDERKNGKHIKEKITDLIRAKK